MSSTERFADMFEGRADAYGTEGGGSRRPSADETFLSVIADHLAGKHSVGVYPMLVGPSGSWWVRWGCVDLDYGKSGAPYGTEEETHAAAVSLQAVLAALGITGWVEQTRTNGRHVWVFADRMVPARVMRRALLAACRISQVSGKEVNPKQERLDDNQLGNYVRLPYYGERRPIITADNLPLPLEAFLDRAGVTRVPLTVLEAAERLWEVPTARTNPPPIAAEGQVSESVLGRLNRLGKKIYGEGPLEGRDRSSTLFHLAVECARSGLTADEGCNIVADADRRWGQKYCDRKDATRRYADLVTAAYERR